MQHWNRDSEVLHVGTALTRTLQGWCDTIVWETLNCKCSPYPSNQQDLEWRVIVFNVPPELDTDYFLPAIMDCSTLSSGSFHLFWAPLPCSVFSWPGSWRTKESESCRESGANLFSIWLAAHYTIRPSSVILFIAMMGNFSAKRARPQRFFLNLSPFHWRLKAICLALQTDLHNIAKRSVAQPSVNKKCGAAGDNQGSCLSSAPWYSAQSLSRKFHRAKSWWDSVSLVTVVTLTHSASASSSLSLSVILTCF